MMMSTNNKIKLLVSVTWKTRHWHVADYRIHATYLDLKLLSTLLLKDDITRTICITWQRKCIGLSREVLRSAD